MDKIENAARQHLDGLISATEFRDKVVAELIRSPEQIIEFDGGFALELATRLLNPNG